MSAYADLIPGASPSRRRTAYDDLLPASAPAAVGQPAEVAEPVAVAEPAPSPGIGDRARAINEEEIAANQPARATMSRRGGVRIAEPDLSVPEVHLDKSAPWLGEGGVLTNLPAGMVASGKNALANVARMFAEEKARTIEREIGTGMSKEQEAASTFARSAQRGRFFSQAPEDVVLPTEPDRTPTPERVAELKTDLTGARKAAEEADLKAADTRREVQLVSPTGEMGTGQKAVWSLGTSAAPTAAGIAAGILTKNPFLAMAIAGGGGSVLQGGSTYGEARDEHGATHEVASKAALVDALLEGAGEALPLKVALKPGTKAFKRIANTLTAEAGQEGATQVMQDLNAYLTYNPEITLKEAIENLKVAALAGAAGGAVFGGTAAAADLGKKTDAETHFQPDQQAQPPVEQPKPAAPAATAQPPVVKPTAANEPFDVEQEIAALPKEGPAPVKVPATPVDQATDVVTMREAARTYAKDNFVNTQVKNTETGFDIDIRSKGVRHATANANPDELAVVTVLPQLLEGGRYLGAEPDLQKRPNVKAFHKFEALAERGGEVLKVHLVVRETPAGKLFYDHAVTEKQTPDGISRDQTASHGPASGADESLDLPGDDGNLGMPGHVVPAGTINPTASGATPPAKVSAVGKEQARPDAIRTAMRTLFGAPISEKGLSKKYLGIYKIKPQTVRLQNRNDLRTAAHEIGHHISNLNRAFRKVMRQNQPELVSIAPQAYIAQAVKKYGSVQAALGHGDVRRLLIEEGFAEFIAEYLTAPATLQAKVPGFYKEFEAWLAQNPTYAQSLEQVQGMVGAHEALSAEDKILAKVGVFKPSLLERGKALVSGDTWAALTQGVLDKWHPLKMMVADLAPGLAASKNPYLTARLLPGDAAVIEDWVTDFTSPYDYQKRLNPKNYGKSLKQILAPILEEGSLNAEQRQQELNRFKAYLIARRAAELKRVGKENLFTREEIAAGLRLDTIQPNRTRLYEAVAKGVYEYNDRLLDYAVEGGLLSPEVAAEFRKYAAYIPFFREPEGESKTGGGKGSPFKRLTGGTQNVRDPIANLIQNTANIIHATNRNAVVRRAVELAQAVPGGGRWIESVKVPQEAQTIATERILEDLAKQGVKVDTSMAQNLAAMQTFFTPSGKGDERTRTIVYKDGGQLKAAQINDVLLWKALGNLPPLEMDLITKILAFPARTLRAGVVLDPTFMVRNFVRDTLSSMIQSKGTFLPGVSTADGMKLMAQKADAYKLWRSFGGAFGDQFHEPEEAAAAIERMAKRGKFSAGSILSPVRLLTALQKVGSYTESGSRIGEFKATYKPGDFESALQAAFNSREVSTDFGMKGGNTAVQVWTRLVPFMNPAMQGIYKTARVLGGADGRATQVKAATIGTGMALASILLAMNNSGEDWYERLEEWEKATYWHFRLGGETWRIPKPFEYGMLFASTPEAIALRAAGREDNDTFKKRMAQILSQVLIRVVPQTATILAEPWANKSFFTGRKIVPDRQENLEPGLQANPNTSKVAQVAGEAANVSPAMIDNAVRNVFGTIGVHATTAADLMLEQTGAFPAGREKTWRSWPAIKAFVHDPDNPNSKQMRDFYDELEKYRRAVASLKELKARGDVDKAAAYEFDKSDELASAKDAEGVAKKLARIRKNIRAIDWDRTMTPAEKRAAINAENEEAQEKVEERSALYQAAKKSYARPAKEGGQQ